MKTISVKFIGSKSRKNYTFLTDRNVVPGSVINAGRRYGAVVVTYVRNGDHSAEFPFKLVTI